MKEIFLRIKNSSWWQNNGSKTKLLNKFLLVVVILFSFMEIIVGVSIYGFKSQDKISRFVERIIPYPAAFSLAGVVTIAEYEKERDYITYFYKATNQAAPAENDLKNQILKSMIENKILQNEALKFKIGVRDKEIQAAMDQIYQNNGGKDAVEKSLKEYYNLSVKDFEKLVFSQLLRENIEKDAIAHVKVQHILVRVEETATPDQVEEARKKIEGYYNEIKAGVDFSEAAKKYSGDVGSNEKGGELDSFARGDMVKEFEDVAFNTPINQISSPFRTSFGWHILKVEEKSGFIQKSFDDWLNEILKRSFYITLYK